MKKPKVPVPLTDIEVNFADQLDYLSSSMAAFDKGKVNEFRRLSLSLRVLLHKTKNSHPLVEQVGLWDTKLPSYATAISPLNMMPEHSLVGFGQTSDGFRYLPLLDTSPFPKHMLSIDEWKEEQVLRDASRRHFTRWDLISTIADQDGGAHIDPAIDDSYYQLTRGNSMGWKTFQDGVESDMLGIEKAYIRHIAWEAYNGLTEAWRRVVGNRGCECGSGRKTRYCCGRI